MAFRNIKRRIFPVIIMAMVLGFGMAVPGWGKKLPREFKADKVVVIKHRRSLILMKKGKAIKRYAVALGGEPEGHKVCEGDNRTPEGHYTIDWKNPKSRYHLSLHISYPNKKDRQEAQKARVNPGGAIMIHGLPRAFKLVGKLHNMIDWTRGCIAVTNGEIEEIWRAVDPGTPIEIKQ